MDCESENTIGSRMKKQKMEFSKAMIVLSYVIGITLSAIVIVLSILGIECSSIASIAMASWGEIAAANVFYYSMNKKINAPKVVMYLYEDLPDELKEQVDINGLLQTLMN